MASVSKNIIKIIISFLLFLIALIFQFKIPYLNNILYLLSYLLVGTEILIKACKNIFKGHLFDENFLMTIATIGAICINEYSEAVAVMLFYQIGELFQDYAINKSRKSISALMDIRPDYANLYINNHLKKVNPTEVKIDDIIAIQPGEKIPLDGIIIEGSTSIDTSSLTGESMPIDVQPGDEILSGCINLNGLIKVQVTKVFTDSTVNKILDLVENATNNKSKSENFITKFAKYYTPIVVLIALIMATIIPLITQTDFYPWLYRALSFLVISCPCALVISIPLSFFGGIGGASKIGILIKGSSYLEKLSKVDTIVFDKTGTITKGIFAIQKIESVDITQEKLLQYAAYAEYYSTHPIAIAIKASYNQIIDESQIKNVTEIPGYGIKAQINNHQIIIGNTKLFKENNLQFAKDNGAGTILNLAVDNQYQGYILIADEIKEEAYNTIKELKENNINKTIMLTGDRLNSGKSIAKALQIDEAYTDLLPQDKVNKLEQLLKNKTNNQIAFVGDGINDAPVLALADVGIAMGLSGADSAIEASDIVIMTDELNKIVEAIKLSHKTMRIVKENIIFAISIKIIILILSFLGITTMWEAVFADVGVTIIAVLNALRALNIKEA